MRAPFGNGGTVPYNFRLHVRKATEVPATCRSLTVGWHKGVKVISTPPAQVEGGVASWEGVLGVLNISCALLQGVVREGPEGQVLPRYEAKLCFLEVRDEDSVVGHAQLNLADLYDGQAKEWELQVWKSNIMVKGMKLHASIEAEERGAFASHAARPAAAVARGLGGLLRPAAGLQADGGQPLLTLPSTSTGAPSPMISSTTPKLPSASPGMPFLAPAEEPAEGPQRPGMRRGTSGFGMPRGAGGLGGLGGLGGGLGPTSPKTGSLPAGDATSQYATSLTSLPARLVALCNRQFLASGLSSVQQEDALRILVATLQRAREPSPHCGILFSSVPPRGAADPSSAPQGAAMSSSRLLSSQLAAGPARQGAGPEVVTLGGGMALGLPPLHTVGLPSLAAPVSSQPWAAWPDAAAAAETPGASGSGAPDACTKHLYELLSHLSDIRSLAALLSPPSALGFVADGRAMQVPLLQGAPYQDSSWLTPDLPAAAAAMAAAVAEAPGAGHEGLPAHYAPSHYAGGEQGSAFPLPGGGYPSPEAPQASLMSPEAEAAQMLVSQILQGVDQAAGSGEQALREADAAFNDLVARLCEVSHDRELWAHRFLADRELQYSTALCQQALQLDAALGHGDPTGLSSGGPASACRDFGEPFRASQAVA